MSSSGSAGNGEITPNANAASPPIMFEPVTAAISRGRVERASSAPVGPAFATCAMRAVWRPGPRYACTRRRALWRITKERPQPAIGQTGQKYPIPVSAQIVTSRSDTAR